MFVSTRRRKSFVMFSSPRMICSFSMWLIWHKAFGPLRFRSRTMTPQDRFFLCFFPLSLARNPGFGTTAFPFCWLFEEGGFVLHVVLTRFRASLSLEVFPVPSPLFARLFSCLFYYGSVPFLYPFFVFLGSIVLLSLSTAPCLQRSCPTFSVSFLF